MPGTKGNIAVGREGNCASRCVRLRAGCGRRRRESRRAAPTTSLPAAIVPPRRASVSRAYQALAFSWQGPDADRPAAAPMLADVFFFASSAYLKDFRFCFMGRWKIWVDRMDCKKKRHFARREVPSLIASHRFF